MKFDEKHIGAALASHYPTDRSTVYLSGNSKSCVVCGKSTPWVDSKLHVSLCSDSCSDIVWVRQMQAQTEQSLQIHISKYKDEISKELLWANSALDSKKDIIVVVKDQLMYVKQCVESIFKYTNNFNLLIWDNASDESTEKYLHDLMYQSTQDKTVEVIRSDVNLGFIEPNNTLVEAGKGDYVILLNSDTKVFDGWDKGLLGFLQNNPSYLQVGYLGGVLEADGKGNRADFGDEIDYVCGWCSCFHRGTYERYGLFNKELKFAYFEDSDFSLRLRKHGHKVFALHLCLVHHYENKTIKSLLQGDNVERLTNSFNNNQKVFQDTWANYLKNNRVSVIDNRA